MERSRGQAGGPPAHGRASDRNPSRRGRRRWAGTPAFSFLDALAASVLSPIVGPAVKSAPSPRRFAGEHRLCGQFGRKFANDDFASGRNNLHPLSLPQLRGLGDVGGKANREVLSPASNDRARHVIFLAEIFLAYPAADFPAGLLSATAPAGADLIQTPSPR